MSSTDGRGHGRGGRGSVARGGFRGILPSTPRGRGGAHTPSSQTSSATAASARIASARPISRVSTQLYTTAQLVQSTGTSGGIFAPTATASATNTDTFGNRTMSVSPNQHGAKRSIDSDSELEEVARKRYKFDDDFTVLVGQDEVRFVIYKDVFSHRSDFFRAACSQDFKESREKTIRMPEADPEDFRAYMQWAYGGEIVVMSPEEIASGTDPLCALQQLRLGQLYTLANFLGDIRLKNGVTDQIIGLCRTISPTPGFVSYLYEHVPDNSRLRGYILDWFLYRPSPNWLEKYRSELPPAFIADLLIAGAKANFDRKQLVNPHGRSWCYYHQRDTASICPCDLPAPDH